MNALYKEPETIVTVVDYINGGEVYDGLPTAEDVQTHIMIPYADGYMNVSLADLANKGAQLNVAEKADDRKSNAEHTDTINVIRRFDGRTLNVETVGSLAVRFLNSEVQVYALDSSRKGKAASLIGKVDFDSMGDEGYRNVFPLDSSLGMELSRYALGQYNLRAVRGEAV